MSLTKDDLDQIVFIINNAVETLCSDVKKLNQRMDGLEQRMDQRMDGLEQRMDQQVLLEEKNHKEQMNLLGQYVNEVIDLNGKYKNHEKRITQLELSAA
jgi:exonuclease VII large subunit